MSRCDPGRRIPATGLSTIVDPEQPRVDIVFVHGFTGHPERTWSCSKPDRSDADPMTEPPSKRQKLGQSLQTITGKKEDKAASMIFWPRDLLPHTVPDARIFSYGYDTHIRHRLDSPALQTTVYDIAWNFLVALEGERRAEPLRPIIFIVHSLGGIVVKEMLRRSSGCTGGQIHLHQTFSSTKGIIFFGTPHGGADPRGLIHHIAEKLIRAIGVTFNKQVVNTLLPSSERLKELRDEFGPLVEGQQWVIHSFQEQHGVAALGGAKVVEDISSYINLPSREVTEYIERNHMEMCRFAEQNDPEYKKLTRALLRVVEATRNQKQPCDSVYLSEDHKVKLLESLYFDQIDARQMSIKAAHAKTCKWLLQTPEYQSWLNMAESTEHHGLLWIKGKPGAGKSTLMKFVTAHARRTMKDTIILSFFFNARGEKLEKSTVGTYRSLLSQLLNQKSGLEIRLDSIWIPAQVPPSPTYHWSLEALTYFLKQVVQGLNHSSIVCFIDALDECEEAQVREMISFFEDLERVCVSSGTNFRLCFASRHYPHINVESGIELVLEGHEGHEHDIRSYLSSQLKIGKTKRAESIRSKVQEKASGVFMWVALVVSILNKEYDRGSVHALQRKLQELPKDLHTLFHEILTRDNHDIPELVLCLQWVLFAAKPLSPLELYFAILSGTSPEDITPYDPEELCLEDIHRFLLDRSKGLTEITKSKQARVQFIHESVRDFLLKEDGFVSICSDLQHNGAAKSHEQLKVCCLKSMNIVWESEHLSGYRMNMESTEKWPLLEHAVKNLIHYADIAHGGGIDQKEFLRAFPMAVWSKYTNVFEKHDIRKYHNIRMADLLYILAERNAANLCSCMDVISNHMKTTNHRYRFPLFAALANDSREVTGMFLKEISLNTDKPALQELYHEWLRESPKVSSGIKRGFVYSNKRDVATHLMDAREAHTLAILIEAGYFTIKHENTSASVSNRSTDGFVCNRTVFVDLLDIAVDENSSALKKWILHKLNEMSMNRDSNSTIPIYRAQTLQKAAAKNDRDTVDEIFNSSLFTQLIADDLQRLDVLEFLDAAFHVENGSAVMRFFNREATSIHCPDLIDMCERNRFYNVLEHTLKLETLPIGLKLSTLERAIENGQVKLFDIVFALLTPRECSEIFSGKCDEVLFSVSRRPCAKIIQNLFGMEYTAGRKIEGRFLKLVKHNVAQDSRVVTTTIYDETVKLLQWTLAQHHFDWNYQDNEGDTIFHFLASANRYSLLRCIDNSWSQFNDVADAILNQKNIEPDLRNKRGETPLVNALQRQDYRFAEKLLNINLVDPESKDVNGRSPLSWVADVSLHDEFVSGSAIISIIESLLGTGRVDINSRDKYGRTPLWYTTSVKIRQCLRDHGATL